MTQNLFMLSKICILLCLGVSDSKGRILQETYNVVCANHAPPSATVFSKEVKESQFKCMKDCQLNLGCRSFAYNKQTSECHLSRSEVSDCEDLEAEAGALTFRMEKSDLAGLKPDLYIPFTEIQDFKIQGDIEPTIYNNPTLVDGVVGKAVSFNGVDQWADLGTLQCFGDITFCTNGYSMSIWLKVGPDMVDPGSTDLYIISSGGQAYALTSGGMAVFTKLGSLVAVFRLRSTAQLWDINDVTIEADQWFHLGVTWHKDGDLIVYMNGEERKRTSVASYTPDPSSLSSVMHIGKPNNRNQKYGDVVMDEWYFWEKELTAEDMKTMHGLYQSQTP